MYPRHLEAILLVTREGSVGIVSESSEGKSVCLSYHNIPLCPR